jgi:hypothetical protein
MPDTEMHRYFVLYKLGVVNRVACFSFIS